MLVFSHDKCGGSVFASGKDGGQASLLNNGDGGVVRADSSRDGGKAVLSNSPYGASFNIYGGPNGANVFRACAADDGEGIVETKDKNDNLTGRVP